MRRLVAIFCSLLVMLTATSAFAYGRVKWKSTSVKERESKSWRLEVEIHLPRSPDMAHMPMKFEFEPKAYYERAMVDGDKLIERTVPLQHNQSLIESVDVGFMDPGSGKIQSRTRFSFKVTRAHGYEAGEYKVTIKDTRNNRTIGTPTTLKFQGENEIIDRRSIVFTGKEKKKKTDEQAKSEGEGESASEPEPEPEPASEEYEDDWGEDGDDGPPPIEEKPGGCGCRVAGPSPSSFGFVALGGLLLLGARRQRARG